MQFKSLLNFVIFLIFIPAHDSFVIPQNPEENGPFLQGDIIPTRASLVGRLDTWFRWQNATIVYEFHPDYPAELRNMFFKAIHHISSRTCLKFITLSEASRKTDYMYIFSGTACYSFIGRQGGEQRLSIPKQCHNLGSFIHEILHAVGFHHEQSRPDRDSYVKIIEENMRSGTETQFRILDSTQYTTFTPYDYASVMHYSSTAFSRDPATLKTMIPLDTTAVIGQRRGMSELDIAKVDRMYNCYAK